MAYELPTNANTPEALPTEAPPGFRGQGAVPGPPPGMTSSMPTSRALPEPPAGYRPGPLAPIRHDYENSTLFKIGSVLASYGESVPVNLKIRMAQQQSDLQLSEHKLAWDNYYKSNEIARAAMQHQNAQAAQQFISMLPNIGAQLAPVMSKNTPPEQRAGLLNTWKGIAQTLYPGGSDFIDFMSKNLHNVFATNVFLNDPKWGPQFQDLAARVGIDQMYQNPEFIKLTDHAAFDWANTLSASDTAETNTRLGQKDHNVTEDEFRKIVTRGAGNQKVHPQQLQAVLSYLDSVKGQEYMASRGIETGSAALAQDKKRKEMSPIDAAKAEDFAKLQAELQESKVNPNKYSKSYIQNVEDQIGVYLGKQQKQTNPGENPNSAFNRALDIKTNGKVKSLEDIGNLPKNEQQPYYAIAKTVQTEVAERGPLAGNTAKLSMLHDSNANPVYTMKEGRIIRKSGPMTQEQYLSMSDGFTMTPAQKEHNSKIDAAEIGGRQLLKQAETVYKGKTTMERAGEVAAENILTAGPGFFTDQVRALTAAKYPELAAYVARRDAVLGTYAKGLGGEVGVLTDQDIARVKKLFSGAYDIAATRAAKLKAFQQIINLNRKALANVLSTNQGTDNEGQVTPAQWSEQQDAHKSAVNGILGSVEDVVNKAQPQETPVRSLAEEPTSTSGSTMTRAEASLARAKGKQ